MRVAILADHPSWAQALHAEGLRKHAPTGFSVSTHLLSDPLPTDAEAVYTINVASCRRIPGKRVATCVASHAWMHFTNDPQNWRTRGVNPMRNRTVGQKFIENADSVVCRNMALWQWASSVHHNARRIPAGIDTDLWNPVGRQHRHAKLRVGWSGQVNPDMAGRFKGYNEVWLPLKSLLSGRYEFVENSRTAAEALSWTEMADWYRSLDIFICTATAEGTPNGPMCAAACGCAVVSTDVGQIADWAAMHNLGLIVPDYGNEIQAQAVIQAIETRLERLADSLERQRVADTLVDSIFTEYDYRVLSPKTLAFVCGVST